MYSKIVGGYDLRDGGRDALALGGQLARAAGAELVVAGVFPFGLAVRYGFADYWRDEESTAREIERVAEAAGAEAEAFPSSSPARGLHDLALEIGADLVVVGSSYRGKADQVLAGNVGQQLLAGGPCAVAIAPRGHREHGGEDLGSIAVGFDGSPEAETALHAAFELAAACGAAVKVVAVAEPPPIVYGMGGGPSGGRPELKQAIEEEMGRRLDKALAEAPEGAAVEGSVVHGEPALKLAELAAADGPLLMLGSRAYGPLRRVLLGSVSSELVRCAPCPVLVHPPGTRVEL
jgi:nucleotide-binding universal stress UspA family protein